MKKYFKLVKNTYTEWMKNNPFEQSAVVAYYTLFSYLVAMFSVEFSSCAHFCS